MKSDQDKTPHTSSQIKTWILKPKSRKVIYGVTDRTDDPWYLKINEAFVDHGRIKPKEKSLFFNSLKLLVNSGVSFTRALTMLGERTQNVRLSRVCATMVYDMEHSGKSFSQAMSKYPNVFEKSEIKMVYSGELTGKIESTLDSIATQLQKSIELEMRVKSALMYPATVFGAIVLAGVIVMLFVIPRFTKLFAQFGNDLPWMTKILVGTSDLFQNYWWLLLTLGIAGSLLMKSWLQSYEGKRLVDGYLLRAPLIGPLVNNIQTVRIAQNFSTLMKAGIPVNKALKVLGEIMKNSIVGEAIFSAEMKIRKGTKLHEAFQSEPNIDRVVPEILSVGEQTGQISEVMEKLGTQYQMEVDSQLKNLTTIIEPLVIILVGGAVVFMSMAIMLPIFQLQDLFATAT